MLRTNAPGIRTSGGGTNANAVVFYGLVHRSLHYTVSGVEKNLLEPLEQAGGVDVFFHSWDVTVIDNPRAGEHGQLIDPGRVAELLPRARGIFESQAEFDAGVNWPVIYEFNPYKPPHCADEDTAKATIRNLVRSVESRERAWEFYLETRNHGHSLIVAARADMLYKYPLSVVEVEPGCLYVPGFQNWGGINDRFAIGGEAQIAVWLKSRDYILERITTGSAMTANSENLLADWLKLNGVKVRTMDFNFQRVRANGKIAYFDLEL